MPGAGYWMPEAGNRTGVRLTAFGNRKHLSYLSHFHIPTSEFILLCSQASRWNNAIFFDRQMILLLLRGRDWLQQV